MANTLRFKRGLASGIPTGVAGEPLFTTDTFDLYIGNGTTNTRFQKYIASGATTQILRGDGSLYTFPLAISSPSNGQVLKYNGTNWVNDSDAGITGSGASGQVAYFTGATTQAGSNNLFWDNTNGRLGIGTTNPNFPLHVIGNVMVSKNSNYLFDQLDNLDNGAIVWRNADGTRTTTAQITSISDGSFARKAIGFFTKDVADWTTAATEKMRITALGNLHIGTFSSDSGEKLQVNGTAKITGASSFGGTISLSGNANTFVVGSILRNANRIFFCGDTGGYYWQNSNNSATILQLTDSGNLGLGVTPSAWSGITGVIEMANGVHFFGSGIQAQIGSNSFFNGSNYIYKTTNLASRYFQNNGVHSWWNAPSGTAGNAITFTQAMTLDAAGILLVGGTTIGYPGTKLQVGNTSDSQNGLQILTSTTGVGYVLFGDGAGASSYSGEIGYHHTDNSMRFRPNGAEAIRLTSLQNLHVGTFTSDSGEKLQVTGTAKITGASTFGSTMQIAGNGIKLNFFNSGYENWYLGTKVNTTQFVIGSGTNSEILTFVNSGAATFSSSVTAGARYIVSAASSAGISDISYGSLSGGAWINTPSGTFGRLAIAGNAAFSWYETGLIFNISAAEAMRLDANGLGIGMTPAYKLDVSGSARISTAIAIGTTPDTNNPFKILKNLNTTVGIKFENTNTSSLAFSAVQLGTDITGGTAFTNLVYGSSGTSEAGVFKPNGTALINTGSGGLNFLAVSQPIRFFTSTGNGTLRASITNDGDFTQFNGTNPSASTTDAFRMYSADVVAGNAAPHFRTENGAVIKLYQETTSVGNSIFSAGGGNSVLDDSTFDGYTLRQIVKALRNQGILA